MGRRLSRNTLILLVSNGGSAVLSFLIAVLIGRFYGESGLGTYAGVLAWIFPLSFIVEFGFGTMITRDIAQQPELAYDYLRLTWRFRIIVGGLIAFLLCLIAVITSNDSWFLIISSPMIIILPAYSAYTAVFRAYQRMLPIAVLNLGMLISQVILLIIAVGLPTQLIWLFIINTLTSLGQLIGAIWVYQAYFYEKPKSQSELQLRTLISQSRSFAIAGILSAVQARFSILWLESVSTAVIVGLFVASLRFIDGVRMIPNALFGAVYPALASLVETPRKLRKLFQQMMLGLGAYGLIVALVLWILGDEILLLTFGDSFVEAQSALTILGLMLIPFVLRSGWSLYWYALGREKAVNIILVINLILLISLPTISWLTGINSNPLANITYAMLYTELITLALMAVGEMTQWQNRHISST